MTAVPTINYYQIKTTSSPVATPQLKFTPSPGGILLTASPTPTPLPMTSSTPAPLATETEIIATPTPAEHTLDPVLGKIDYVSLTIVPSVLHVDSVLPNGNRFFYLGTVWKTQESWNPNTIFTYNTQTGKSSWLTTSVYGDQGFICCLDASAEWLAWLTNLPDGSRWKVFAKNLMTGREILVDQQEDTRTVTFLGTDLAISDHRLVWSSIRKAADGSNKSVVTLIDLSTGEKKNLAEVNEPEEGLGLVDIDGDRVVWSKGSSTGGINKANVYLFDLSQEKLFQVTDDDISSGPTINGDWMAWRQGFGETGPIVIYNLKTGERFRLTVNGDFLRMGDGLLMWWTYLTPFTYVYDLQKNILDTAFNDGHFYPPHYISGHTIAAATAPNDNAGHNLIEVHVYQP